MQNVLANPWGVVPAILQMVALQDLQDDVASSRGKLISVRTGQMRMNRLSTKESKASFPGSNQHGKVASRVYSWVSAIVLK